MKQKQAVLSLRTIILLLAGSFISLTQSQLLAADPGNDTSVIKKMIEDDKKPAKKGKASKMQNAVKIVPDAFRKSMHVVVKSGNSKKELSLFVFDVNGNMVQNYKLAAGERKTITGLKKGVYVYHVFCEDESIGTGQLEFR